MFKLVIASATFVGLARSTSIRMTGSGYLHRTNQQACSRFSRPDMEHFAEYDETCMRPLADKLGCITEPETATHNGCRWCGFTPYNMCTKQSTSSPGMTRTPMDNVEVDITKGPESLAVHQANHITCPKFSKPEEGFNMVYDARCKDVSGSYHGLGCIQNEDPNTGVLMRNGCKWCGSEPFEKCPDTVQPLHSARPETAQPWDTSRPDTVQPLYRPDTAQPLYRSRPDTAQPLYRSPEPLSIEVNLGGNPFMGGSHYTPTTSVTHPTTSDAKVQQFRNYVSQALNAINRSVRTTAEDKEAVMSLYEHIKNLKERYAVTAENWMVLQEQARVLQVEFPQATVQQLTQVIEMLRTRHSAGSSELQKLSDTLEMLLQYFEREDKTWTYSQEKAIEIMTYPVSLANRPQLQNMLSNVYNKVGTDRNQLVNTASAAKMQIERVRKNLMEVMSYIQQAVQMAKSSANRGCKCEGMERNLDIVLAEEKQSHTYLQDFYNRFVQLRGLSSSPTRDVEEVKNFLAQAWKLTQNVHSEL